MKLIPIVYKDLFIQNKTERVVIDKQKIEETTKIIIERETKKYVEEHNNNYWLCALNDKVRSWNYKIELKKNDKLFIVGKTKLKISSLKKYLKEKYDNVTITTDANEATKFIFGAYSSDHLYSIASDIVLVDNSNRQTDYYPICLDEKIKNYTSCSAKNIILRAFEKYILNRLEQGIPSCELTIENFYKECDKTIISETIKTNFDPFNVVTRIRDCYSEYSLGVELWHYEQSNKRLTLDEVSSENIFQTILTTNSVRDLESLLSVFDIRQYIHKVLALIVNSKTLTIDSKDDINALNSIIPYISNRSLSANTRIISFSVINRFTDIVINCKSMGIKLTNDQLYELSNIIYNQTEDYSSTVTFSGINFFSTEKYLNRIVSLICSYSLNNKEQIKEILLLLSQGYDIDYNINEKVYNASTIPFALEEYSIYSHFNIETILFNYLRSHYPDKKSSVIFRSNPFLLRMLNQCTEEDYTLYELDQSNQKFIYYKRSKETIELNEKTLTSYLFSFFIVNLDLVTNYEKRYIRNDENIERYLSDNKEQEKKVNNFIKNTIRNYLINKASANNHDFKRIQLAPSKLK